MPQPTRIDQTSESFDNFTVEERTIKIEDEPVLINKGSELPVFTPMGVDLVKVYGIRRKEGKVEFGIGNQTPPILGWVTADFFYHEWPD